MSGSCKFWSVSRIPLRGNIRQRVSEKVRHFLEQKQSQCLLVMDNSTVLSGLLHVDLNISKEKPQHFRVSFEHHRHKQREEREGSQRGGHLLAGIYQYLARAVSLLSI